MTREYGLVGWPIEKSLSPALHRAAFAALGIDATYDLFPVEPGKLADAMRDFRARGIAGWNVTVPHKVDVIAHVDELDLLAKVSGAVNTVVCRPDGSLVGMNTDVMGFVTALGEEGVSLTGRTTIVIGAGGAARAVMTALAMNSPAAVYIAARDAHRARELATSRAAIARGLDETALADAFGRASLVVHATPATWQAASGAELVARLPLEKLRDDAIVVDLAYGTENPLLSAARARGLRAIDGRGMLLHQAALAFEVWTRKTAPLTAMRAALSL